MSGQREAALRFALELFRQTGNRGWIVADGARCWHGYYATQYDAEERVGCLDELGDVVLGEVVFSGPVHAGGNGRYKR